MSPSRILWVLVTTLLAGVPNLLGQGATGAITGVVTDTTGAVIPNAQIRVENVDTGLTREMVTDATGLYRAGNLPPGNYRVSAKIEGFQAQTKTGLLLSIDQIMTVGFELSLGQVQETVTVVAQSEQLIEAETSSLGQVIAEEPVRRLPLNGRNYRNLIALNTGTQPGPQGQDTEGKFHINGGRSEGNLYLVEGVDVSSSFSNAVRINPALESISEFKVLTNNFSAEYGRSAGGVISVRLKGGTNEPHGTLFHFLRNRNLDARNFFADEKPKYILNQFGGSLGGPIQKNKFFVFGSYQGTRVRYSGLPGFSGSTPTTSGAPGLFAVPPLQQREGDFSSMLPAQIYDPLTSPREPFPNNRIPQTRFDSPVKKMLDLLPAPNRSGAFNFQTDLPARFEADALDIRSDYYLSQKDTITGTFSFESVDGRTSPPFGELNGFFITGDFPHNEPRRASINYTRIFSPTVTNELILGFGRERWHGPVTEGQEFVPDLGVRFLNVSPDDETSTGYPLLSIPGFTQFGSPLGAPFNFATNIPQITDNLSFSKGRHFFKTGFTYKARQFNAGINVFARGFLIFNALTTAGDSFSEGSGLASSLLGYPLVGIRDRSSPFGQRQKEWGFYFQDDFKVNRRLTLNLGVRYDLFLPATEHFDRVSNFDLDTKTMVLAGQGGVSDSTLEADTNNFSPHVGFAYSFGGRQQTVLRGGYGLAYQPLVTSAAGVSTRLTGNPPFTVNSSQVFSFINPTVRVSDGIEIPPFDLNNPNGDIVFIPRKQPTSSLQHWTLNLQRTLTEDWLLDVAYAGSSGKHLTGSVNLNQAPPGPEPPSTRSPISASINNLNSLLNRQSSTYHSLQLKLTRRFAEGFYLLGAYTYSKSIDDGSFSSQGSIASPVQPQDSRDFAAERGRSDFDVGQRLVVSYIYELPFGRGKRFLSSANPALNALLGGWQIVGITTLQEGPPFTPTVANDRSNSGPGGALRPNRIGDGNLSPGQRTPNQWFDVSAFEVPPNFTFGNSGRNVLEGPGLAVFDFSLFKDIPLSETMNLQFRAEFFNIFNRPNFNLPVAAIDTPQAGQISSARDGRQIQFGLKLIF